MQSRLPFQVEELTYPSMASQLRAAQIRSIIEMEQKEAILYRERMAVQILRAQQSIRNKGISLQEGALRLKSLKAEQFSLKQQIKEANRALGGFRQGTIKVGIEINEQKNGIIKERFAVGEDYAQHLKHKSVLHQSEVEGLNVDKINIERGLNGILSQRLDQKRHQRQKLIELQQDILNLQMKRESIEIQIAPRVVERERKRFQETFRDIQKRIIEDQGTISALKRKNQYLYKELEDCSSKGMAKIGRLQKEISDLQSQVKKLHDGMTQINLGIENKYAQLDLMQAEQEEKNNSIKFRRNQISNIISDGNAQLDLVRFSVVEERKTIVESNQRIHQQIIEIEKALRSQQGDNKGIKSQYQKLCNLLISQCQGTVRATVAYSAPMIMRAGEEIRLN